MWLNQFQPRPISFNIKALFNNLYEFYYWLKTHHDSIFHRPHSRWCWWATLISCWRKTAGCSRSRPLLRWKSPEQCCCCWSNQTFSRSRPLSTAPCCCRDYDKIAAGQRRWVDDDGEMVASDSHWPCSACWLLVIFFLLFRVNYTGEMSRVATITHSHTPHRIIKLIFQNLIL